MRGTRALAAVVLSALLPPAAAFAQANLVVPRTPGQNRVRWDRFDWRFVDLLQDEDLGAGVRLYYYAGEEKVARYAAAAIALEYRHLVRIFDHEPSVRIPYILYDSHQELEQTNLFRIGEGTLGVTSPLDLRMTTAYWGDHRRFHHVSLHEMAHQFTIQKVDSIAKNARAGGSPLLDMPLWFIEGLAEYYSTPGGFGADDERWVRDLIANPAPERGWFLRDFFDDAVPSFAFTYKIGQARVVFLSGTYGEDVVQRILDESYRLRPGRKSSRAGEGTPVREPVGFPRLLQEVTGDPPERIDARWKDWLKRRYYAEYLAARQQPSDLRPLEGVRGEPDWFTTSPAGDALVYRSIEPVTGVSSLVLVGPDDPESAVRIARDGHSGVDSLHYFDRPVAALTGERIAWIARRGPNDVVHVGRWERRSKGTRTSFRLGSFRTFDPRSSGIRELGSPAFSPDGTEVAFVALDGDGIMDVWTLALSSGAWRRVTNDLYAERELDWGEPGIAVSSDRTPHGNHNLFLVDPATGERRPLTASRANHRFPRFVPGGTRLIYSGDEHGKWDVFDLKVRRAPVDLAPSATEKERRPIAGQEDADDSPPLLRRTDLATGITWPSLAGDRYFGLALAGGRLRVCSFPRADALSILPPGGSAPPPSGEPWPVLARPLSETTEYKPWNTGNWAMEQAFVALGAGNGVFGGGFLFFQDILRDRTVRVQGEALGDLSLTTVRAEYFDRARRIPVGSAVYLSPAFVLDPEVSTPDRPIYFVERKAGVAGLAEYPFNRFVRIGAGLGLAGTHRTVPAWLDNFPGDATRTAWEHENGGWSPQLDASAHAGYDTLVRTWDARPIAGTSLLATANAYCQPARATWFGDASLDVQHFVQLGSAASVGLRGATGQAFGDEWRRPYYVYSVDNLRGVPWYRYDYLIADSYLIGQTGLGVPLDRLVRIALLGKVIGVAGVDMGALFDRWSDAGENATAAAVLGFDLRLAIFDIRLHFARPFDVGGLEPGATRGADGRVIVPDGWVTNFSIRYAWY